MLTLIATVWLYALVAMTALFLLVVVAQGVFRQVRRLARVFSPWPFSQPVVEAPLTSSVAPLTQAA